MIVAAFLYPVPYGNTSAVRINLLRNPRPASTTHWTAFGGTGTATISLATNPVSVHHVQGTASTSAAGPFQPSAAGSIVPGKTYAAAALVAVAPSPVDMRCRIQWMTSANAVISAVSGTVVSATGSRQVVAVQGVAPAGASYAQVQIWSLSSLAAGQVVAVSEAILVEQLAGEAFPPAYFDGTTADKVGVSYEWTGTADLSTSTETTRTPTSANRISPSLVLDYAGALEVAHVEHVVIGREDHPMTLRPLGLRRGTLGLFFPDHAAALACQEAHRAARMMLRDDALPGLDMYYTPRGRVEVRPAQPYTPAQRWEVTVDYVERSFDGNLW